MIGMWSLLTAALLQTMSVKPKSKSTWSCSSLRLNSGVKPLIMCSCTGRPGWARQVSYVIANELGVGIHATSGPAIERQGDLVAILTSLEERDVLFIDEIHRLSGRWKRFCTPLWKIVLWIL